MTDTEKVCAALRACDECDPHGDNVLAGCHSCRLLVAVAEVVEAAQDIVDDAQSSEPPTDFLALLDRYDEAIRRAAEVCG